jgi:assimilatory nitrate reductase catalytic subunit
MFTEATMSPPTRTTCPYCGVGCGVLATPAGTVAGDPAHPANAGRLCSKGAALGETIGLQGRLLYPEIGGIRASWNDALDTVASRFARTIAEHGPDSVALYVSGQLLTEDYYAANKFAKAVLGTANIDSNSRLCMASSVAGHRRAFGEDLVPGIYEDLELADLLVLVGSNTAWCHPVLYQRIQAARAKRPHMRVVVIDPRRTATCQDADLHLPLQPGTDVVLFSGLLADLWRHGSRTDATGIDDAVSVALAQTPTAKATATACGLAPADVQRFFEWVRETPRTVTLFSQGVNQASSGTDKVNAIINVHLLTGRIGLPGAGPFSVTGQPNAMGGREVGALANTLAAHLEFDRQGDRETLAAFWRTSKLPEKPGLKAVDLFRAIGEKRVRAVWIIATNPAVSLPNGDAVRAAFDGCDFVVLSDCAADTDTGSYAHVRLPALAWGEKDGTVTNSERMISRQRAFLPVPGEARADWWAVAQVASRLGGSEAFAWRGPDDIFREHASLSGFCNDGRRVFDISALAALSDAGYDTMTPTRWPCRTGGAAVARLFRDGRYPTADGRARMVATPIRAPAMRPTADYPLVLLTGRVRDQWHTMTRTGRVPRLMAHMPEPFLAIHPAETTLADGALATVRTALGSAVLRVRHDEGQRRGTLFAPMHWTAALCEAGRINAAVTDAVDPISGQPELKQTPAAVMPFAASWHAFLIGCAPVDAATAAWSCLIPQANGVWRHELADDAGTPAEAFGRLGAACGLDARWMRLHDAAAGSHRAVLIVDGRIEAALFVGPDHALPDRRWLSALFDRTDLPPALHPALLAGREPGGPAASSPVCVCHGVDAATIRGAIVSGCRDLDAVGQMTAAGTGCGSCRPEIRALLLDSARVLAPA